MSDARCTTCKFLGTTVSASKEIVHICRALPPKVTVQFVPQNGGVGTIEATAWPRVRPDDWCGEHQPELVH